MITGSAPFFGSMPFIQRGVSQPAVASSVRPSTATQSLAPLVRQFLGQDQYDKKVLVSDIKWGLKRFPELTYHIGALASFTAFTNQYPWVGKDVYGPGGISVVCKPRLNQDQALIDIVNQALISVTEEAATNSKYIGLLKEIIESATNDDALGQSIRSDMLVIKEIANKLLAHNNIYIKLYRATKSLVMYSACVVDFSEDYSIITFYGLNELEYRTTADQKIDLGSQPIGSEPAESGQWYVKKTGKPVSERAKFISDEEALDESPMGRVIHYLRIMDVLETSISVERVAKSNSFVVWKVGADGIPGDVVNPWLDVYKERVMGRLKAGTQGGDIVQTSMSRALTASHIFVPNFKESPTDVQKLSLEYRPLMDDIQYWWSKVFLALGIPPYYAGIITNNTVDNNAGDMFSFHENVLGTRVRMYQSILEKVLVHWIRRFIAGTLSEDINDRYTISVLLPMFVSGGEERRSEYMRRVNQFASAASTLSVSGMPLDPEFSVQLMFPNADPKDVIDWHTRRIMNAESYDPYGDLNGPDNTGVVDNMSTGDTGQTTQDAAAAVFNMMENGIPAQTPPEPQANIDLATLGLTQTTGNRSE